jgi:AI-2 transport protein TqsA
MGRTTTLGREGGGRGGNAAPTADPTSVAGAGPRRDGGAFADSPILSAGLLGATGAVVLVLVGVLALREVASLVLPVITGLFIALVAWPMVGMVERHGVRHGLALASTIAAVLIVVVLAAGIAALSVGELVVQLPRYESRLGSALASARDQLAQVGIASDPAALTAIISPEKVFGFVEPVASAVSEAGGALVVVAFTVIYALTGAGSVRARAAATLGDHHPLLLGMERFGTELRSYLVVRTQLGVFAAVLSGLLLIVLGVPLPILWAILVFFASFVPNIGAFIAVIPPTLLAFLDGGPAAAAIVVAGYGLINFIQDQLLQPVAMGSELNLSPLVVFVAVVAWAWILGPAGALLAVPLTVGIVMVLEAFPSSRGVAGLLRARVDSAPGDDVVTAEAGQP